MHACMLQAVFDVKSYQLSFCNYLFVLQAQLPCKKLCQYSLFFLSTFIPTVNFCISYNDDKNISVSSIINKTVAKKFLAMRCQSAVVAGRTQDARSQSI